MSTPPLTAAELRKFGWLMAAIIAAIFGLFLPWIWSFSSPLWAWIVVGTLAMVASVAPRLLAPVFKGWMAMAEPLGRFNNKLLLVLMYVSLIVPLGLLFKTVKRDPLRRTYDADLESYRTPSINQPPRKLERPF